MRRNVQLRNRTHFNQTNKPFPMNLSCSQVHGRELVDLRWLARVARLRDHWRPLLRELGRRLPQGRRLRVLTWHGKKKRKGSFYSKKIPKKRKGNFYSTKFLFDLILPFLWNGAKRPWQRPNVLSRRVSWWSCWSFPVVLFLLSMRFSLLFLASFPFWCSFLLSFFFDALLMLSSTFAASPTASTS